MTKYIVYYTNINKREKSPAYSTREEAEECAEFLKFQGAKRLSIRQVRNHQNNTTIECDWGCDPIGDGAFRMVPSGDIVDFDERNRRLAELEVERHSAYFRSRA